MKIISTNPSRNYEVIGEVEAFTEQDIKIGTSFKDAVKKMGQTPPPNKKS